MTPLYYHNLELKAKKRRKKKESWKVFIGPYLGYKINSKWNYADQTIDPANINKIKKLNFGFTTGIEFQKKLRNKNTVGIDLRYTHGINNIYDHRFFQGYLRNIELGFSYYLNPKKKKQKKRK